MAQSDIYPQAPPDNSGGFMVISGTNGTDTHRHRIHVLPFNTNKFIVGGGTPSVDTDDGNHDYAYTPDRPAGQEAGITDTFAAYVAAYAWFYPSTWTFTLSALYQRQNDGTVKEVFPLPTPTAIHGAASNAGPVGMQRCLEYVLNFRTSAGNKARIVLIGQTAFANDVPAIIVPHTPTIAPDDGIVKYVSSGATAVVAHDGQKFAPSAHRTTCYNRRLRRHYGYA